MADQSIIEAPCTQVRGQGCTNCRTLSARVLEVLSELKPAADFEHITDLKEIARFGVLESPTG
jgi:hypothetical protein